MYRVKGLILYKQIIRDNYIRNIIFTEEYGKITAWERGISKTDIGSIVELLVERQQNQNNIKKISLIKSIPFYTWSYEAILEYLSLLKILYQTLPEGVEQKNLYAIIIACTKKFEGVGDVGIILISQFISLKVLGYIGNNNTENQHAGILENLIHAKSMKSIPFHTKISDTDKYNIKKIIYQAIHSYSFHP